MATTVNASLGWARFHSINVRPACEQSWLGQGPVVRSSDLSLKPARDGASRLEDMSLEEVEAFLIKKAMARYDGNVSHAAGALGLSRSALYRRLQRYGL